MLTQLTAGHSTSAKRITGLFYISPFFVSSFLFFYFFLLPPILGQINLQDFLPVLVSCLGFIALIIGARIGIMWNCTMGRDTRFTGIVYAMFSFFLFLDLLKIILMFLFGFEQALYSADYRNMAKSSHLYLLFFQKLSLYVKYLCYSLVLYRHKRLFYITCFITLFASFENRARMYILNNLIFFGILSIYFGLFKLSFLRVVSITLLAPFAFLIALIKRDFVGYYSLGSVGGEIHKAVINILNDGLIWQNIKTAMECFKTYEFYYEVIDKNMILPLNGFIRIFFNPIPRIIWSEKPLPLQNELARHLNERAFENGGGIFAGLFGDLYLNGGMIFVLAGAVLLGTFFGRSYRRTFMAKGDNVGLSIGMYSVAVMFFVNFWRGYFSDMLWQFILFLLTCHIIQNSGVFLRKK